jgi:hypothetical protein
MKIVFNCKEGFFCALTWALYCWRHADETGQKIRVEVSGPYGLNYLNRYIHQDASADGEKTLVVREYGDLKWPYYLLDRKKARDVFSRHAEIRKAVLNEADMFTVNGFLGAHYRGTDKIYESKQIPFNGFCEKVYAYKEEHKFNGIYFATDVRGLELLGDDVIQRKDDYRSDTGLPIHKSCAGSSRDIGMDAIVNCLLLSRCRALIRTRSHLSAWAGIFNPKLEIVTLNQMHDKVSFPEE